MQINKDAFSNGQIESKIWLCEELEEIFETVDHIWIYGGWYGISAFLLKSRNKINISTIRSFDIDPECQAAADMINENWVFQNWQFKAFTEDCNNLIPKDVDLIINTSTEHFDSMKWFDNIPDGTVVALQGNNMPHDDHHVHSKSLEDFKQRYSLSELLYEGEKEFVYPNWSFTRYMIIGQK